MQIIPIFITKKKKKLEKKTNWRMAKKRLPYSSILK